MSRLSHLPGSLALVALLAACAQDTTPLVAPDGALMAGKPGTTSPVSLKVTISSDCTPPGSLEPVPCRITSDPAGDYLDGVDYVKAVLDQYGQFIFDTNNSRNPAKRYIDLHFTRLYKAVTGDAPPPDPKRNFHFATIKSKFATVDHIKIQEMALNTPQCLALGSGYGILNEPKLSARLSFHRGYEDTDTSPTAYAVVTRTGSIESTGTDTWTIAPGGADGTCRNVSLVAKSGDVGAVRNGDGTLVYGYYHLPFIFTLTRK